MDDKLYRVKWEIDVYAVNPQHAATKAQAIQRDPDSIATVFDVTEPDGAEVQVDLDLKAGRGVRAVMKALKILLKYEDPPCPFHCEHDYLWLCFDAEKVSERDIQRLEVLGFFVDEGGFKSFRYGS